MGITSLSLEILIQETHRWVETMQVAVHLVNTLGERRFRQCSTYYDRNLWIDTDSGNSDRRGPPDRYHVFGTSPAGPQDTATRKNRLEAVLQTELQDAPGYRTRRDHSKVGSSEGVAGFIELCVIPEVEEFRSELKRSAFPQSSDSGVLDDRRIKIELRAATHYSDAGVAETRAAAEELGIGSRTSTRVGAGKRARSTAKQGSIGERGSIDN